MSPGLVKVRAGSLGLVALGQAPQVILGQEDLVAILHQRSHPGESQLGEDVCVLDGALFLLLDSIVSIGSNRSGPEPLDKKLDKRQTNSNAVGNEIRQVRIVELLRDEGTQLDGKGKEEKQPVEQRDAAWVADTRVLKPLNGEYNKHR